MRPLGKLLLAGALTLWCVRAPDAYAQTYIGLTAGATVAAMTGGLIERADVAFGAAVGANFEWQPWQDWMIDGEFLFTQKGVSNVPEGFDRIDFRQTYLEMPVTLNRVIPIRRSGWYVSPYLGVAAGINRGCDIRSEGESEYEECTDTTLGGTATTFEFGIPLGVALRRVHPGGSRLAFEARYALGLTTVLDAAGGSARNSLFTFLFSFALPLGRANP